MDTFGFFAHLSDDDSEDNQVTPACVIRKQLRCNSNPLDMTNKSFIKLFRVSKEVFKLILDETRHHFKSRRNKDAIPPILKLASTLRFLAEGSYQQAVGQDFLIGMAQSTVSVVLSEMLDILENYMCQKYISYHLSEAEREKSKEHFLQKTGFPGVVGCIDGTHINIIRPVKNEHHFFNRKGAHSLNVMITCDYKMEITSVDASYGGCSHDSVIWRMSNNRIVMEQKWKAGDRSSWLLGDSGYALEPWMMTPFRKSIEGSQESKFNSAHSKARSIIERVFGILKGRWRCLLHTRELHYTPEKAAQIVNVCCLLHNLCTRYNVPLDEHLIENEDPIETYANEEPTVEMRDLTREATILRDQIKNN